jgi:hypothetical protein
MATDTKRPVNGREVATWAKASEIKLGDIDRLGREGGLLRNEFPAEDAERASAHLFVFVKSTKIGVAITRRRTRSAQPTKGAVEKLLYPIKPMPDGGLYAGCAQSEGDEASSKPAQGSTQGAAVGANTQSGNAAGNGRSWKGQDKG